MRRFLSGIIVLLLVLSSCSVTRTVPKGHYVVTKEKVEVVGSNDINPGKLEKYIQQPELKRFLGFPLYTYLYNIPDPAKDKARTQRKQAKLEKKKQKVVKKFRRESAQVLAQRNKYWNLYKQYESTDSVLAKKYFEKYTLYAEKYKLMNKNKSDYVKQHVKGDVFTWWEFLRKIGDPPPLYDTVKVEKSAQYIESYLKSLGYYHARVEVETKFKGEGKVEIKYIVKPGKPLIIDSVVYEIADSALYGLIINDKKLRLSRGKTMSVSYLQKYREKVVQYLKENGYYYFTKDYITFAVDTTGRKNKAVVYVRISPARDKDGNPVPHQQFYINNIYIFTDYDPNKALSDPAHYFTGLDTQVYKKNKIIPYYFIRKYSYIIRPKYILKEVYLTPGQIYKFSSVRNTYLHLSKFAIYKLVNVDFTEVPDTNLLNCNINLTPAKSQSVMMEIVGTNSSATIGGALNMTYRHKNLFRGGEIFSLKFHTALESQKFYIGNFSLDSLFNFNTQEYGVDAQVMFPRLLLPFKPGEFIEKNNPKTVIQFSYNFQDRPEYNRKDLTYTWSYYWKANPYTNHIFTPSRISSVSVWDMIPEFLALLQESYLLESYENYFIFGTNYSFTFSNQGENYTNTVFFQLNLSSSGNLLYELMKLLDASSINGSYYMPGFKTFFAQFVKADYDFRVYHSFYNKTYLVWRMFTGVAVPYKNSKLMPFGEKYFIGGSNSIRAWQARTLGPGSYALPADVRYPNQTGDIRLETNLEYRYPLIWKLEGALFLDVGNIWAINRYDNRPGALFQWNEFYKQLAVGTGTGIRLNLGLVILRLDLGVKLYDPAAPEGYRFIPATRPFSREDFTINVAIGYPF